MNEEGHPAAIATTKMRYKGEEVSIAVYKPILAFSDSGQYSCAFSISGAGIDYSGRSIGIDSMQSLVLSIKKIGSYLQNNENIDVSCIEWEGGRFDFPEF